MDLLFNERQELINQMERIFYHLGYKYSKDALNKILTEWFNNKKDLIELMSKHPNYVPGKFYIQFDCDFSRDINTDSLGILYNSWYIDPSADIREEFLHKGNEVYQKRLDIEKNVFMPSTFVEFLNFLQTYSMPAVDENFISEIEPLIERYGLDIKIAEGMKTSRAINKLCVALGLDKMSNYNKIFAVYADALSPLKVKRHTVISCNPIDYLLMSNGNSWTSCHTINKFSKSENNYGGCCASGTISYMLDGTSMVYYEVSADYEGNEIEMEPKIMRQMFHFGQHALVQGRLYPQSNDNGKDFLYAEKRNIVQKVIADILNVPNRWIVSKGTGACEKIIEHEGTHYHDTANFSNCNVSYLRGYEKETTLLTVGHDPYCIECGNSHSYAEAVNCCHAPSENIYTTNIEANPMKKGTILK